MTVYNNFVSPGYFESVAISLLRGRDFSEFDRLEDVDVAILNEAAASGSAPAAGDKDRPTSKSLA
jgi:hypothetical protein